MLVKSVKLVKCSFEKTDFPPPLRGEVCFVGRSNVGKSSLLNAIFGRKMAYVSKTPGKTRTVNFYEINRQYYFVDLPGYGFSRVSKQERFHWKNLIENYFELRKHLVKLSILLVDSRREPSQYDIMFVDWVKALKIPVLAVLTKSDKISRENLLRRIENYGEALQLENGMILSCSSLKRQGIDKVVEKIAFFLQRA